jgi:hypothetical protein
MRTLCNTPDDHQRRSLSYIYYQQNLDDIISRHLPCLSLSRCFSNVGSCVPTARLPPFSSGSPPRLESSGSKALFSQDLNRCFETENSCDAFAASPILINVSPLEHIQYSTGSADEWDVLRLARKRECLATRRSCMFRQRSYASSSSTKHASAILTSGFFSS